MASMGKLYVIWNEAKLQTTFHLSSATLFVVCKCLPKSHQNLLRSKLSLPSFLSLLEIILPKMKFGLRS